MLSTLGLFFRNAPKLMIASREGNIAAYYTTDPQYAQTETMVSTFLVSTVRAETLL